jgi:hypothetical protein
VIPFTVGLKRDARDVLKATITVEADSQSEAERVVRDMIDAADPKIDALSWGFDYSEGTGPISLAGDFN